MLKLLSATIILLNEVGAQAGPASKEEESCTSFFSGTECREG